MHLPVVDPVFVLGLTFRDLPASEIRKEPELFKAFPERSSHFFRVGAFFQIENDVGQAVVLQLLGHHFPEHALSFRIEDWLPVADLYIRDAQLTEKPRHQVFRLRGGMDRKALPLHF